MDDAGSIAVVIIFLFIASSRPILGAHTFSYPKGFFPGVQRQGLEADHLHQYNAEAKKRGTIAPLPIRLHTWSLSKHRENFTLYPWI
jgi:hypothetical protein